MVEEGRSRAMRQAMAASGDAERALQCLAEAIYFEARGEPEEVLRGRPRAAERRSGPDKPPQSGRREVQAPVARA